MRIKNSRGDRQLYILACLFTFGIVFGIRLLISEAIRQSIQNDKGVADEEPRGFRLW